MNYLLHVLARKFHVDKHSALFLDLARACDKNRACFDTSCKEKLSLKRFLEWNLNTDNIERFDEQIEKLAKFWINDKLEFYCCYHFEPYRKK